MNSDIKSPWLKNYGDVPASLDYPDCSMAELLFETAKSCPNQAAFSFMGRDTSYAELVQKIDSCARSFAALGVRRGTRVMLCLPNIPQAVICFYALNLIGAVAVMVHPLAGECELEGYINSSNSRVIVTLDQLYCKFAAIGRRISLPTLVIARIQDALSPIKRLGYSLYRSGRPHKIPEMYGILSWTAFVNGGRAFRGDYVCKGSGNIPSAILYSGGTSGKTKGVLLSNLNFNALGMQTRAMGHCIEPGGSMLSVMPVFHGFGLGVCIHTILISGCCCSLVPRFNVKTYAELIKKHRPNYIAGVPTLFEALLRDDTLAGIDLSCLSGVFSGGDSLSSELKRRFDDFLAAHGSKVHLREGYGTTECVTASCLTPYNIEKEGSIGLPFPDMFYKIVKPGGCRELPYGEAGDICISGPTVMLEYTDMPDETARALRRHPDGRIWLHTGDIGCMDSDGFIYFLRRMNRTIVSSGYSISPAQLESVINSHPDVETSCVIGIPDSYRMQRPKAFVVLRRGVEDSPELRQSIIEYCRKNIAKYAMFKELEILPELPKTPVGKIAYSQLEAAETAKSALH